MNQNRQSEWNIISYDRYIEPPTSRKQRGSKAKLIRLRARHLFAVGSLRGVIAVPDVDSWTPSGVSVITAHKPIPERVQSPISNLQSQSWIKTNIARPDINFTLRSFLISVVTLRAQYSRSDRWFSHRRDPSHTHFWQQNTHTQQTQVVTEVGRIPVACAR